jgi:dCMP deaminase
MKVIHYGLWELSRARWWSAKESDPPALLTDMLAAEKLRCALRGASDFEVRRFTGYVYADVKADGADPPVRSRPTWDEYFMALASVVATRSPDTATKHGCVLVDRRHRIISTGYNGPVAGIPNDQVPLTRPEKYPWLIHAEENAVLFAERDKLEGATAYVTGHPCAPCTRRLLQVGVARVVFGDRRSKSLDSGERALCEHMAASKGVTVVGPIPLVRIEFGPVEK